MADAVEVTAEADMVIVAHEVQHIVDVTVNAFDAGIVVIVLQKLTGKGNADEAVVFVDCQNLLVIQVTRMRAQSFGVGVGCDNRLAAGFDNIPEACGCDMGNVNQHTELVHFGNYLAAENGETAAAAFFVDTIGNIVTVAPGKSHCTHA